MITYVPGQPYTRGMPVVTHEPTQELFRSMAFATFSGGERLGDFVVPAPPPGYHWKVDPDILDLVACPGEPPTPYLPKAPPVTKPQDKRMIATMEGATVGGRIVLPSGLVIPGPPADFCWTVRDGQLLCVPVTK